MPGSVLLDTFKIALPRDLISASVYQGEDPALVNSNCISKSQTTGPVRFFAGVSGVEIDHHRPFPFTKGTAANMSSAIVCFESKSNSSISSLSSLGLGKHDVNVEIP